MPRSRPPLCDYCGLPLPGASEPISRCRACCDAPPAFAQARAPWQFADRTQDAIHAFKYRQHRRIGRWLADGMSATARAAFPLPQIRGVVPVPQHWLARRLRGADPAGELAAAVSRALEKPCLPRALRCLRRTASQTRLSWEARQANVREAFAASRLLGPGAYLLIDDVLTSGATAHACAAALRTAGAEAVFVLTAARTPLEPAA